MVNRRIGLLAISLLLVLVPCFKVLAYAPPNVGLTYRINRELAKVWINKDGTIDLFYNITVSCSDESIGILAVPLPNPFQIAYVEDRTGASLQSEDVSSGNSYLLDVHLKQRIGPGYPQQSASFLLQARVEEMVWEDTTNKGNVGVLFAPAWWENPPAPIDDLRVLMVLPEGVKEGEIKTTEVLYDNLYEETDRWVVYWERPSLGAAQRFEVGVSFPEEYVEKYYTEGGFGWWPLAASAIILSAVIVVILLIIRRVRREVYEKPRVMVEALGSRRGLTSVEAAVVVGVKPVRVLTMILFGLLLKRLVLVEEVDPLIKVRKIEAVNGGGEGARKRYYEIDFLQAIEPEGSLNERRLARTYLSLRDNVDRKMRGYSREDTVNYYKSITVKAWEQVTRASTPQLQEEAIEQNIRWLLVDENYDDRFRKAFPPNIMIIPHPGWYWYWYGPYFSGRSTRAESRTTPTTTRPTPTPSRAQPLPVQEFANRIVSGFESTTNNIVRDAENFASRLIPSPRSSQSSEPVRSRSSCACACASCACACVCVSCACACAGGGAR